MRTLRLAGITLLVFLAIGFASCNKDNNGDSSNEEIIEYQGEYPAPENIEYVEEGVTYEIEAIPGQVVISTDEDYNTVINAVNAHGGKIIEQYPQYGLYTVEVVVGNENGFVAAMNDLNISAELNLIEYPKERYDYFVFDDYANANGVHHGRNISNILSECQNDAVINEINNVVKLTIPIIIPFPIPVVYSYATTLNYTNFLLWNKLLSQDMVLVNWSHGYGSIYDWQTATESEKSSFKTGWKKSVARKLDQIIRLKKKNSNMDIVFAIAAGNERCPELAQMINDLKSNPQYKKVLEENVIFVSDYSKYGNTSSQYGDFCFIKEHPYYNPESGTTSYASPQALCYINQVIKGTIGEDGKNITAVQALAAVKAAIRQNSNGELDLDEALAMARNMYSPNTNNWDGTSWTFTSVSGFEELKCYLTINNVSNNDVLISFVPDVFFEVPEDYINKSYVIDDNGQLVFTATLTMDDGDVWKVQVTFVRTGSNTATANFYEYIPIDGGATLTGLLQGTMVNP